MKQPWPGRQMLPTCGKWSEREAVGTLTDQYDLSEICECRFKYDS